MSELPVQSVSRSDSGKRLLSLDILRGLDIFFLTVGGPLLWAADRVWGLPGWMRTQLIHADWVGLTAWDLIMPWFIFMCGAAIPFALPKRLDHGRPGWRFWRHVLGRVLLLWFWGMVVQGNLLSFDGARIAFYNNTLQSIAAGYLIAALAFLLPRAWMRALLPLLLAALYGTLLACFGDYTPSGNFAIRVERFLIPSSNDTYSWCLTTLMFGAMTLLGMACTDLLRSTRFSGLRKMFTLFALGAVCLGGGLLLARWEPAIKRIFTVSFTLQAMGWGILALAALYTLVDLFQIRRGWGLLTLYGQHALLAYLCSEAFGSVLHTFVSHLTQGFPHLFGARIYPVLFACISAATLTMILLLRRRLR